MSQQSPTIPPTAKASPLTGRYKGNAFNIDLPQDGSGPAILKAVTGMDNLDASAHLIKQLVNVSPEQTANSTLALLNDLAPETPLQGLLASQAVACHTLAMKNIASTKAATYLGEEERRLAMAHKLMSLFLRQTEALHKLKQGSQQTIVVQHVNVAAGGQAAIAGAVSRRG